MFRIEDAIQEAIQAGTKTLRDFEDQAVRFDLRTRRDIGQADVVFNADRSTDIVVKVRSTTRAGRDSLRRHLRLQQRRRVAGARRQPHRRRPDRARVGQPEGMLRVGWDGSSYEPDADSVIWDNPLRFGPDIVGTPSQGRMALWPANTLTYLHGTGASPAVAQPAHRLPGAGPRSQRRRPAALHHQHGVRADPAVAAHRPGRAPDVDWPADAGDAPPTAAVGQRPVPLLERRRRHARFDRPDGLVAYDSTFTPTASSSEYFSVKRVTFDADAAVQVLPSTAVKLGYSHLASDYTHRIWETTAEDVFRVSTDVTGHQLVTLRAIYENRSRTGDHFEPEALQEVGELAGMRHFDVANRDRQRLWLVANLIPGGIFGVTGSAGVGRDDYPDSPHGLQSYDSNHTSPGVSVTPDDRYQLTASYGWERYQSLQRSRNATTAADQQNPLRDWTTDYAGKVNYLEAAVDVNGASPGRCCGWRWIGTGRTTPISMAWSRDRRWRRPSSCRR